MLARIKQWVASLDTEAREDRRIFAVFTAASALGLLASLVLSIEAFELAKNTDAVFGCDFNSVFSCSAVARHESSHIFGFPNSLLGLSFPVFVTIGIAGMDGVRFPRWFMRGAQIGALLGLIFAAWMFYTSYVVIGVLCPWCLATDVAMLVVFTALTRYNVRRGHLGARSQRKNRGLHWFVTQQYDIVVMAAVIVVSTAAIILKFGT